MNAKLTLKLNRRSIEKAKKYAKKNKLSLSGIIENYFEIISENDAPDEIEISPNVLELAGVVKLSEDENIKEAYGKHLEEKYAK